MNREWTEEELEILRRDRAAKIPVPVIAAKLNRPVPATYQRARLIGTQVQKHQAWDEQSVSRLRAMVNTDPPMTDKIMAEKLGRTVSQIRWKMQDLGLIGLRDLSKLAKIAAAGSSRQNTDRRSTPPLPLKASSTATPHPSERWQVASAPPSLLLILQHELSRLLKEFNAKLKDRIAESETGMMHAAMAAITEKKAIDVRLAALARSTPEPQARVEPREIQSIKPRETIERSKVETIKPLVPQEICLAPTARPPAEKRRSSKPNREAACALSSRPLTKASVSAASVAEAPAAPAASRISTPASTPSRVVVLDTPAPASPSLPVPEHSQTSGRGGWKAARRDPARVTLQARGKAANRADAINLAQAAQMAIETFIVQRGVTRDEATGAQALVKRLQARGYIVVGEGDGWTIDQRHRVAGFTEPKAFAAARGILVDVAA